MNTESSYEGAARRLRSMGHTAPPLPAFDLAGARSRARGLEPTAPALELTRVRELEELASLACEENERLETAMAELRSENASLKRRISLLEAAIADPRTALGLASLPSLSSLRSALEPDELPRRGAWLRAGLSVALLGVGAAAVLAVAAAYAAGDSGLTLPARLRSPITATLDGVAAALDAVVARGHAVHPRYGQGLVPAGWAPTLPEPEPAPAPRIAVAPPAPIVTPAVIAPVAKHPAKKREQKHAVKKLSVAKAQKLPKHIKPKGNDPLSGLDL